MSILHPQHTYLSINTGCICPLQCCSLRPGESHFPPSSQSTTYSPPALPRRHPQEMSTFLWVEGVQGQDELEINAQDFISVPTLNLLCTLAPSYPTSPQVHRHPPTYCSFGAQASIASISFSSPAPLAMAYPPSPIILFLLELPRAIDPSLMRRLHATIGSGLSSRNAHRINTASSPFSSTISAKTRAGCPSRVADEEGAAFRPWPLPAFSSHA